MRSLVTTPFLLLAASLASSTAARAERQSPKKVIAVSNFENKAQQWDDGGGWYNRGQVGDGMRSMLVEALVKTGKFTVVERGEGLNEIKQEQALKKGGDSRGSGAEGGQLMAAQALFRGEVSDYTPNQQGGKIDVGGLGPLSNVGLGARNASVSVIVRWFDTTSGEVLDSWTITRKKSSVGFAVSGYAGIPFGTEAFTKTPVGKATQEAVNEAVDRIVGAMAKVPFQCKVIKQSGDQVFVNAGGDAGVAAGDRFDVFSLGEAMVDPDSGANLGAEKTKVGTIKVNKVNPKFSVGSFEGSASGTLKSGDVATEAEAPAK